MNIAVIFAGGTGSRMNTKSKPKQFLEVHGKPILVYTLEAFDKHPEVDGIVLVVLKPWIDVCNEMVEKFKLLKVKAIIEGGNTAIESQKNGLHKVKELFGMDNIVLIHDGVRPMVDSETIYKNIYGVKKHGNAITVTPAIETITVKDDSGVIAKIIDRNEVEMARAPQSFRLMDILDAHKKAEADGLSFIDSASMMMHYGYVLHTVKGLPENIKITTPNDFYTFRALLDAKENSQIFGI